MTEPQDFEIVGYNKYTALWFPVDWYPDADRKQMDVRRQTNDNVYHQVQLRTWVWALRRQSGMLWDLADWKMWR